MGFPAITNSNSLNFPPKSHRNPKPDSHNHQHHHLPIGVRCGCEFDHIKITTTKCSNKPNTHSSFSSSSSIEPLENQSNQKTKKRWVHFVGIGGCGLSALAKLALKQGLMVSGSDIAWSGFMDGLREAGAELRVGHSVSNIERDNGASLPDAVVVSSAVPADNVEVLHSKALGVPVYKRDHWLEKETEHHNLIAVSGTHGKSTTTSMLAYVLSAMGDDLTAVVGAHVPQFPEGNILSGRGHNFVLEADEYDGCFLRLSPHVAVVTSVEWEHVDIFQDEEAVKSSFRKFLKQIRASGHLILCGDSEGACSLLNHTKTAIVSDLAPSNSSWQLYNDGYRITTYGISHSNEWHASCITRNSHGGTDYLLCHMERPVSKISLQVPGLHNVLNSLAVIATIRALIDDQRITHASVEDIRLHLSNFVGVSRRFEMIGQFYGCHIYDDYAHHPTEVRAVIQATRQKFPLKALWVVFQPHTFSRLAALMKDFAVALGAADRVVVTEIYAAREANIWNVSGRDLANSVIGPPSEYIPLMGDVVDKLAVEISANLDKEIVVLMLGAGDITTLGSKLFQELQKTLRYSTSKTLVMAGCH